MGHEIEWPPDSGEVAFWEDHELDLMRRIAAMCERGEITRAELKHQMDAIQIFKVELGARVATDREVEALGVIDLDRKLAETKLPLPGIVRDQLRLGDEPPKVPVDAPERPQEATERLPEPPVSDRAHARTGDPWTSHAAAAKIGVDDLRDTQTAVLEAFRDFGAMHHERLIEVYEQNRPSYGWPQQSVSGLRTRTSELVDAGILRNSGKTVMLPSNRQSIVWESSERSL